MCSDPAALSLNNYYIFFYYSNRLVVVQEYTDNGISINLLVHHQT